jgi:hypothetical protein
MKTLEERKAILEAEIAKQQRKGWQIQNKTETSCLLIRENKIEACLVIVLLLLFILPLIIYLIVRKKNVSVFVEINNEGEIIYTGKDLSPYELSELKKEPTGTGTPIVNTPPASSTSTNNLGLLTSANIADGLKMSEEEVVNLIETDQLKGKKIGDKYFVRKEDFDEFMRK